MCACMQCSWVRVVSVADHKWVSLGAHNKFFSHPFKIALNLITHLNTTTYLVYALLTFPYHCDRGSRAQRPTVMVLPLTFTFAKIFTFFANRPRRINLTFFHCRSLLLLTFVARLIIPETYPFFRTHHSSKLLSLLRPCSPY